MTSPRRRTPGPAYFCPRPWPSSSRSSGAWPGLCACLPVKGGASSLRKPRREADADSGRAPTRPSPALPRPFTSAASFFSLLRLPAQPCWPPLGSSTPAAPRCLSAASPRGPPPQVSRLVCGARGGEVASLRPPPRRAAFPPSRPPNVLAVTP